MDVLGIVGSSRKSGNTDLLVQKVLAGAQSQGLETRMLFLSDFQISHCCGCEKCRRLLRCTVDDGMQEIYPLLEQAKGLVLGSPTYFYNVSGLTKSFIDRLYCYEFFDKRDRSVWLGLNEVAGIKYAVTVAVCEQEKEEDMGFASEAMHLALKAVGYRVIEDVKAFHAFLKGDVNQQPEVLERAFASGKKLAQTLHLHKDVGGIIERRLARGRIASLKAGKN